jgi:putative ubiquitin-RnfH superfamily antitoxin RatB of RatAB toxin-antitoxin module
MGLGEAAGVMPVSLHIEVVVGLGPRHIERVALNLPPGSTLKQAIDATGWLGRWPGLDQDALAAGRWVAAVWGRKERPGHVLKDRDRVELLRGLNVDPKEARRARYKVHKLKAAQVPEAPRQTRRKGPALA